MDMTKEAIEKIVSLVQPELREIEGRTFALHANGETEELRPTMDFPTVLDLTSLDAMVQMIRTEAIVRYAVPLYIVIPTPSRVECFAQPDAALRQLRMSYYVASATDVPGWCEKVTMPFEEAMIALRTRFQDTPDTLYALKLLSEISKEAKITYNDNGAATTGVTKRGSDLQANEQIRPIVKLKPYRTFQEVEQPESEFLIRISERGITFVEADGGMWRLAARKTIKSYFETARADMVDEGRGVIML